ncbi:Alkyl/aryl-sulfatase BDS1 [Nostocoides japonicum T1-X7]|uniref:Linear primary-alkylsulfatase n=1 Tax=Nostocoides japonicum T1-X7 TaxID=1194083 RepID=A0A077LTM5_9MICO|nr:alkyl sulfatase dimerization domain-containing protein [Tetrasphaera japonica]CCH76636.1 Alkyl/aryl-sulfatase BDS1 [Tetrasphaera japonica T1-X7]
MSSEQIPTDSADPGIAAAERGFVAALTPGVVHDEDGVVVWDSDSFAFTADDAPETVHPSLWRQSKLTAKQGLFEVAEGIYQVRGLEISNLTLIEGDTGVVVVDTLQSVEVSAAAMRLYREHRGDRPVVAVILTHCHADHFGGIKGVVTQEQVDAGVPVIAPAGFFEAAVSENVYAGTAMARRATYMYGSGIPRGPLGAVSTGNGPALSTGTISLMAPTVDITRTGEELTIDGVRFVFQLTPNTEAPAEMHFYLPDHRALCMAENATHTMHNILTIRGAVVRDAHEWARYLTEAIELFADRTDVVFATHHWPTWGSERVREYLSLQRDLYAYLHDQTLRLMNLGHTGPEIAEELQLPPALREAWHVRGYYGSVSHNVKAIYQRYLGWYDGNPARLWPHPPEAAATRYVALMGGADTVVAAARAACEEGDLRWAAQILDHVVFAEPHHAEGRELLADVFERLGFQAENATWRNAYLSGAAELRGRNLGTPTRGASADALNALAPDLLLDAVAIQVDGPAAWDLDLAIGWRFPDHGAAFRTTLRNGVFTPVRDGVGEVRATVTVPRAALGALATGDLAAATMAGLLIEGDGAELASLLGVLQAGDPAFTIVEP